MLTPSSNTVLEPYTAAMMTTFGERASVHFGRFKVTEISMSAGSQTQFDTAPILRAARLLADANVDVIAWNGTSAGWMGFERDLELCRMITGETGIPATSTVLAQNEVFGILGVKKLALVTPYLSEIQDRIIANYESLGIEVAVDRRLEDRGNFTFAEYSPDLIADLVRSVAAAEPDAISIFCTNFRGAPVVDALEREFGIPIVDSVAVTLWSTLRIAGLDPSEVKGWGRLFTEVS